MDRNFLLDLVNHNANEIEKKEGKSRIDAEFIAICLIFDDLSNRRNGREGYLLVMDILFNEYSKHHNDVITYLGVKYQGLVLKPEYEKQLLDRFR